MNKPYTILATLMMWTACSQAEGIVDTARKLSAESGSAIIHVTAINKITVEGALAGMMGGGQEQKAEAVATIIDPSGLAILAESAINPTALMGKGMDVNVGGKMQKLEMKSELSDVKYRLADGTEFAGRIVLKDEDLDIAFVVPEKPVDDATKAKFSSVAITADAPVPVLLEELIALRRFGRELSYQETVALVRVEAIIKKPRPFYIVDVPPGTALFNADRKFIGLAAVRRGGEAPPAGRRMTATPVVVPAIDIAELAAQAREEAAK